MADYSALKQTIDNNVNTNGQQAITGAILNDVLNEMVDVLGEGYTFLGVATISTNPTTPEGKAYYLAGAAGTYTNFGNIVVSSDEVALLVWDGTAWAKVVSPAASKEEVSQIGQKLGDLTLRKLIDSGEFTPELGAVNPTTGANVMNNTYLRPASAIPTPECLELPDNYVIASIVYYDAWISNSDFTYATYQGFSQPYPKYVKFDTRYPYVRFSLRRTDSAAIYSSQFLEDINSATTAIKNIYPRLFDNFTFTPNAAQWYRFGPYAFAKDHKYKIDVTSPGSASSLSLRDAVHTIIKDFGSLTESNYSFEFVPENDLTNLYLCAYYNSGVVGQEFSYSITDVTANESRLSAIERKSMFAILVGAGETIVTADFYDIVPNQKYRISTPWPWDISEITTQDKLIFDIRAITGSSEVVIEHITNSTAPVKLTESMVFDFVAPECDSIRVYVRANVGVEIPIAIFPSDVELEYSDSFIRSKSVYSEGKISRETSGNGWAFTRYPFAKGASYTIKAKTGSASTTALLSKLNETADNRLQVIATSLGNGKSVTFTANQDALYIGAYCVGITELAIITNPKNDAIDINNLYAWHLSEHQENLLKWSNFSALFFSDIHASVDNFERIKDFANSKGVDCVLNGGDTVLNLIDNGIQWYNDIVDEFDCPVLATPGNHDAWTGSSWNWATKTEIYNTIIAKVASSTQIVQPSGAEANGLCYYYKDINGVRIISLLAMDASNYWDSAQSSWLESTLADARTNGLAVIIITHAPFSIANTIRVDSKHWNSWWDYRVGCADKNMNYDGIHTAEDAVAKVDAFINAGGTFICWLTGHTHADNILYNSAYPNQFMFNTTSARFDRHADGVNYNNPAQRGYDAFNYIGVDLISHQFKVVRIGWNEDSSLRHREILCYNYSTHEIMAEG